MSRASAGGFLGRLRASLRLVALLLLTLLLLVPALLVLLLAAPFGASSARPPRRLALRALLAVQRLWALGVLAILGVRVIEVGRGAGSEVGPEAVRGAGRGLLVCNHLSYLDIPVLASRAHCRFVAKSEVAGWPVIGFLARVAGVIFVDRSRRRDLVRVGEEVRRSLAGGLAVAVFPEGTSTAGATVLPFHPGLLEPAAETGAACLPVALRYETPSGSAEPSVAICWWGDMTFGPHVWRLMQLPRVTATLSWAGEAVSGSDRKLLATALHGRVLAAFRPMTP
ncbi:MAG: lysophospholipid acyltransferase family protein [Planctomycetota bacterium]